MKGKTFVLLVLAAFGSTPRPAFPQTAGGGRDHLCQNGETPYEALARMFEDRNSRPATLRDFPAFTKVINTTLREFPTRTKPYRLSCIEPVGRQTPLVDLKEWAYSPVVVNFFTNEAYSSANDTISAGPAFQQAAYHRDPAVPEVTAVAWAYGPGTANYPFVLSQVTSVDGVDRNEDYSADDDWLHYATRVSNYKLVHDHGFQETFSALNVQPLHPEEHRDAGLKLVQLEDVMVRNWRVTQSGYLIEQTKKLLDDTTTQYSYCWRTN